MTQQKKASRSAQTLLALCIACATTAALAKKQETSLPSEKIASQQIINFHKFGAQLYRGARPQGNNFSILKKLGIKTVIDLQGGDIKDFYLGWAAEHLEPGEKAEWIAFEEATFKSLGINFVNLQLSAVSPITADEGYGIGSILAMMNNPSNQPVYVHCEHGKDRTGLVVALYRVFYQNWKRMDAWREMLGFGHAAGIIVTSDMDSFFFAATKGRQ